MLDPTDESSLDGAVLALHQGEQRLVASATAGTDGSVLDCLPSAFAKLRALTSRDAVKHLGLEQGLRIEDLICLELTHGRDQDPADGWRWLGRQIPRGVELIARPGGDRLRLRGVFRERHGPPPARPEYVLTPDGRVQVEAFELHVMEHCNLRCANCCNMSPLVARRTLSLAELAQQLGEMSRVLFADVFKIMGGEPLLHPDLPGVLQTVRSSGISNTVRLFTNGLLLHTMTEDFWRSLDQLTISNYQSAPVKPHLLALAESKARQYDFILNAKPVSTFSQVLSPRYQADPARVEQTYQQCWLRHRCLIARNGRFYKCTRAAYAADFHAHVARDTPPPGYTFEGDGVPLDGPDLATRLRDYLNASTPLASCHYCLGGDGPVEKHHQLSAADVRAGRLSRGAATDA